MIDFDWPIKENGDFGLFVETRFLISSSSNENRCVDSGGVMKSRWAHWTNIGIPRPNMGFWISDDSFALLKAGFDGGR